MSTRSHQANSPSQPADGTQHLVVWGERRKEPDWDTYIAALLAYALREVEGDGDSPE